MTTWTVTCKTGPATWSIVRDIAAADHEEAIRIALRTVGGVFVDIE